MTVYLSAGLGRWTQAGTGNPGGAGPGSDLSPVALRARDWISEEELTERFGLTSGDLEQARADGSLSYSRVGSTFLYSGHSVADWFEASKRDARADLIRQRAEKQGQPPPPTNRPAAQATTGATRTYSASGATQPYLSDPVSQGVRSMTGSETQRWNDLIRARMACGMSRSEATRTTAKSDPELHAAFLREINNDRPVAVAQSRFRTDS